MTIGILNYGAGNMQSVKNALEYLGQEYQSMEKAGDFEKVTGIICPGVGNFGSAIRVLQKKGLLKPLRDSIEAGTPYLGICLGYQLLFEQSEESPGIRGLGILKGNVRKFRSGKVPHIGWNTLRKIRSCSMLRGLEAEPFVYFVHAYYPVPREQDIVCTRTEYSETFASSICTGNITATQFHLEKSGETGLKMLRNWCTQC